jgi:hypothetical protein
MTTMKMQMKMLMMMLLMMMLMRLTMMLTLSDRDASTVTWLHWLRLWLRLPRPRRGGTAAPPFVRAPTAARRACRTVRPALAATRNWSMTMTCPLRPISRMQRIVGREKNGGIETQFSYFSSNEAQRISYIRSE